MKNKRPKKRGLVHETIYIGYLMLLNHVAKPATVEMINFTK